MGRDQVIPACARRALGKLSVLGGGGGGEEGWIRFTQEVSGMVQARRREPGDKGEEGVEKGPGGQLSLGALQYEEMSSLLRTPLCPERLCGRVPTW